MNTTTSWSTVTSQAGTTSVEAALLETTNIGTPELGRTEAHRVRRVLSTVGRLAMQGVIASAPAINLYWCIGLPPYDYPPRVIR
jgi:hypothetical protein